MKHPKKRALALALTLAMSLTVPALAAEDTAETSDPVVAALAAAETYGATTSIQYALWKDGEIVSTGGSGVYSKT